MSILKHIVTMHQKDIDGNIRITYPQTEIKAVNHLEKALEDRILKTEKGSADGVATLDDNGKVPVAQLPPGSYTYQVTLPADSNWEVEGDIFRTSITVDGILATDNPIIDLIIEATDSEEIKLLLEEWNKIFKIITSDDLITLYCMDETPTVYLKMQIKVVR